jgi:hypothetical protein
MNHRFFENLKDVPFDTIKAQATTARARMLQAWSELPDLTPEAAFWIRKAGAEHYAEHLPRLREWIAELQPRLPKGVVTDAETTTALFQHRPGHGSRSNGRSRVLSTPWLSTRWSVRRTPTRVA